MFPQEETDVFSGAATSGHLVDQQHSAYPARAHAVWRAVRARNATLITEYGHRMNPAYLEGIRALELPAYVPQIEQLNRRLLRTGWRTVCVDGCNPSEHDGRWAEQRCGARG